MKKIVCILGAFLLAAAVGTARADTLTFTLNEDGCLLNSCGSGPFGTITISDNGSGDVNVTEQLNAGYYFAGTDIGISNALDYNLSTKATGYTNLESNLDTKYKKYLEFGGKDSSYDLGSFTNSINCTGCGLLPAKTPDTPQSLSFTIDGVNTSDFVANADGNYFASDIAVYTDIGGKEECTSYDAVATGNVGAGAPPTPAVPEPAPLLLLGTGLVALVGLTKFGNVTV